MTDPDHDGRHTRAEWNLLVTAQEGAARDLKRLLKRHGVFRWSEFRNVLLGQVTDSQEFLRVLSDDLGKKPFVCSWLGKVLPIDISFQLHPATLVEDIQSRLPALIAGIRGKSFHVRVERRGHKGEVRTHDLERQLGDYLWEELERSAAHPTVSFKDPDVIIAVEIVGQTAGIAVVPRKLRQEFPFVKID
jgi:tRNA(Ser,Leu) C12 N-acetylase TAN1